MNMSYSTKVPASQRTSILSLAVSFPFLCCASILFCPPPRSARARVSSIFLRTLRVYWADSGASSPAMPVTLVVKMHLTFVFSWLTAGLNFRTFHAFPLMILSPAILYGLQDQGYGLPSIYTKIV